eukprot:6999476-Prorocentrum_lima.AAC.1
MSVQCARRCVGSELGRPYCGSGTLSDGRASRAVVVRSEVWGRLCGVVVMQLLGKSVAGH